MRRTHVATLVAVFVLGGALLGNSASAGGGASRARGEEAPEPPARVRKGGLGVQPARWVEGEVLVSFKPGVPRVSARGLHRAGGARVLERIRVAGGVDHVRLPAGVSVEQAVAAYEADPRVAYAEPNLIRTYTSHTPAVPDDDLLPEYWSLNNVGQAHSIADPPPATAAGTAGVDINAPEAWAIPHTGVPVIGVMDSGVDVTHPDLGPLGAGQLWVNPGEGPVPDGLDNDANGFVDDISGWNFGGSNGDLSDGVPHGTHVAGTIAAATHNDPDATPDLEDGVGICPHCKIMVLKLGSTPTVAAELQAISYAISKGANGVNMSFGGGPWSQSERDAIKAMGDANILASISAGNSALDNDQFIELVPGLFSPSFPASYNLPNIISVAASNHHDEYGYFTGCAIAGIPKSICAFSNIGHDSVDVAAPGVDILSTVPPALAPSGFAVFDGTSMSAPHVSGLAGLLKAANPALTAVQIKNAIMNSSDRPPGLATAYSPAFKGGSATGAFTRTSGRINALAALTTTDFSSFGPSLSVATPPTDGNVDGATGINKKKKGRLAYPADVNDVFKRTLKKGKKYEVTLDVPKSQDFDLWVWKPKTQEIWQLEAKCVGAGPGRCQIQASSFEGKGKDESVTFKAKKPGTYYFHVSAWLKSKGRYTLTITQV